MKGLFTEKEREGSLAAVITHKPEGTSQEQFLETGENCRRFHPAEAVAFRREAQLLPPQGGNEGTTSCRIPPPALY